MSPAGALVHGVPARVADEKYERPTKPPREDEPPVADDQES